MTWHNRAAAGVQQAEKHDSDVSLELSSRSTRASEPHPIDLQGWHLEFRVKRLEGTVFQEQRMVLTRDVLGFGQFGQGTEMDDVIPLREIESVKDLWHHNAACRAEGGWVLMDSMIGLKTIPGAYNLGRAYCISASFPLDVDGRCSCRPRKLSRRAA